MELLFLGGYYSKELESVILKHSKGTLQSAANRLQSELIQGFEKAEVNLSVLSAPLIGSFPKVYSKCFFKGYEEDIFEESDVKYVSFFNLWGFRNYSRKVSLQKELDEFINSSSKEKLIFVYSPHTPFLQAAVYAKKRDPKIKICLYVPDLPQYMNLEEEISVIYKVAKKYDIFIFNSLLKDVDSFIFITKYMENKFTLKDKPWMVVEGIATLKNTETNVNSLDSRLNGKSKKIVYTGSLYFKFGIRELVEAFKSIEREDLELVLCGSGDAETYIKESMEYDKRIKYLGSISNEEAIFLQENAAILVNPRNNNEEYTKYSFPSKTMEYLMSGNPVVCYKLDGIPNDYDPYLFYIEGGNIKQKLEEILNFSEEQRKFAGLKGKTFVYQKKNNRVVVKNILSMLNQLFKDKEAVYKEI